MKLMADGVGVEGGGRDASGFAIFLRLFGVVGGGGIFGSNLVTLFFLERFLVGTACSIV
jgi:hypothetical protein